MSDEKAEKYTQEIIKKERKSTDKGSSNVNLGESGKVSSYGGGDLIQGVS